MSRKRLLIINGTTEGGACTIVKELKNALETEFEVKLCVPQSFFPKAFFSKKNSQKPLSQMFFLWWEKLFFKNIEKKKAYRFLFSMNFLGLNLWRKVKSFKPDLIHIHWLGQNFASLNSIGAILKSSIPVVWTFHDSWAFTGGCHHPINCTAYKFSCGNCTYLKSPNNMDVSHTVYLRKQKWTLNNLTVVTPSNWLKERVEESSLFKSTKVVQIQNPHPIFNVVPLLEDKRHMNKVVIGMMAVDVSNEFKGGQFLSQIVDGINRLFSETDKQKIEFVIAGNTSESQFSFAQFSVRNLGYIRGEANLVSFYQELDLFLIPSFIDNYPTTILESHLCGTPVIGFDCSGVSEMILDNENGFKIEPYKVEKLIENLKELVRNPSLFRDLKDVSRHVKEFNNPTLVKEKYLSLFNSLITKV